jgi:hypothetical protein
MNKFRSDYEDKEIEEFIPEGYEESMALQSKSWEELEKDAEKKKNFCVCDQGKPRHVIISKAMQFWVCDKCKKECDEPKKTNKWNPSDKIPF